MRTGPKGTNSCSCFGRNKIRFVLRVDDAGWTPQESATPPIKVADPDLALTSKFHAAMGGRPFLAGIIGAAVGPRGRTWLGKNPVGLVPACHGWDHGIWNLPLRNEFEGMPVGDIRSRIACAREVIGRVEHLIPPYNAIATNLAEAAYLEGIKTIWTGPVEWPTPPSPVFMGPCLAVPAWARFYGACRWAQGEVPPILATLAGNWWEHLPGIAVITLHLTWELARDPDLSGVRELSRVLGDHLVHPDVIGRNFSCA